MKNKYKIKDLVQNAENKLLKIVCKWQDIIRYYTHFLYPKGKRKLCIPCVYIFYFNIMTLLCA